MPLPFANIDWYTAKEKLTGSPQSLSTTPIGVLNRPLDQLQQNIEYLETQIGGVSDFTGLSDTPGIITANEFLRGNGAGDAIVFSVIDHDSDLDSIAGDGPQYNHLNDTQKNFVTTLQSKGFSEYPNGKFANKYGIIADGASNDQLFRINRNSVGGIGLFFRFSFFAIELSTGFNAEFQEWSFLGIEGSNAPGFQNFAVNYEQLQGFTSLRKTSSPVIPSPGTSFMTINFNIVTGVGDGAPDVIVEVSNSLGNDVGLSVKVEYSLVNDFDLYYSFSWLF